MIPAVVGINTFGGWLRSVRLATIDPTTGNPYTQERIGELMHVSGSKVAAWERGQIASISPDDAGLLAGILKVSQRDILEAIGYEVGGDEGMTQDERDLLAVYRRLVREDPALRSTAHRVVQALLPNNAAPAPRPPRRRSA